MQQSMNETRETLVWWLTRLVDLIFFHSRDKIKSNKTNNELRRAFPSGFERKREREKIRETRRIVFVLQLRETTKKKKNIILYIFTPTDDDSLYQRVNNQNLRKIER